MSGVAAAGATGRYHVRAWTTGRTRSGGGGAAIDDASALIGRLRGGDEEALAELYAALGRRAFGLAYRVLGDEGAAEEAVQEAFLALWRQAPRLDPERGRIDSLLLTIVHRRAIDVLRAGRRAVPSEPLVDEYVDEEAPTAFDEVFQALAIEEVAGALGALRAEQREAIELAYFEGLTAREIAERSGAPRGTATSRLRLGLERLRELLVGSAVVDP